MKEAVSVPVFANGNILSYADITRCLIETGADAVMSAEGQLYNPALFTPSPTKTGGLHPRHADLALEYLDIVSNQNTPTTPSGIKGHLFKLLRPALSRETDLRDALGQLRGFDLEPYYQVVREMKKRMDKDAEVIRRDDADLGKELPHWVAQPYVRPLPAPQKQVEGERQISFSETFCQHILFTVASVTISKCLNFERTPKPANGDDGKRVGHDDTGQLRPSIIAVA